VNTELTSSLGRQEDVSALWTTIGGSRRVEPSGLPQLSIVADWRNG
jgi:hypothetical protein